MIVNGFGIFCCPAAAEGAADLREFKMLKEFDEFKEQPAKKFNYQKILI